MLTWSLFERRFGGDQSIVGRQIHLDGKPYTVVGILPKWFIWPDAKVQIWVPFASGFSLAVLEHHDYHFSRVVARLRPNVSLATALSQVEAVQYALHMQNLNASVAEDVVSKTLIEDLAHDVTTPLIILLCAAGCMLLIGCLNVANLQVARSGGPAKGNRNSKRTWSAKNNADSRAAHGEPAALDCRRINRSTVVPGGHKVARPARGEICPARRVSTPMA